MTNNYCYLDNAATTKMSQAALDEMTLYCRDFYGNPSSVHKLGKQARIAFNDYKKMIANIINCETSEIYITSGGTESDNWALQSIASARPYSKIIISSIEHSAILETCKILEKQGHEIVVVPVDHQGIIDIDYLESHLDDNTSIVSIMHANNEIGTIQDISKISKIVHKNGSLFHTDAVQSIGHIPINVKAMGVDLMSASAHKFNGPKGIGFLYCSNEVCLTPFIVGGHQQMGLRAGTENIAGLAGMAKALEENQQLLRSNLDHVTYLEKVLLCELSKSTLDYKINGNLSDKLPGLISISFKKIRGEALADLLAMKDICVSTGSACNSQSDVLSHVLASINLEPDYAYGTIRISIGRYNTEEEIVSAIHEVITIVKKMQNKNISNMSNDSPF